MDKRNISYNNIYLTEKDIKCFKNSNQLNDMCISFYFEYLTNEILKESKEKFVLLDPVVVSSIYFDESIEDLSDMLFPLNLHNKNYILFPINDNTDRYAIAGGTHWSLLIYSVNENLFIYFDSTLGRINTIDRISTKFTKLISFLKEGENKQTNEFKAEIIEPKSLEKKQFNSYDCGMFVLEFAQSFLEYTLKTDSKISLKDLDCNEVFKNVNQEQIKAKRLKILEIIKNI